jgi:hypothetical protein
MYMSRTARTTSLGEELPRAAGAVVRLVASMLNVLPSWDAARVRSAAAEITVRLRCAGPVPALPSAKYL